MKFQPIASVAAACTLWCAPQAKATLYAYNGFDYASGGSSGVPLANGTTLVGLDPSTASTGSVNLAGVSVGAVASGQGGLSNIFQTTGLTFGNLAVTGGGARYDNDSGQAAYLSFNYSGPTATAGTTLYTAYLTQILVAKNQGSVVSLRANTSKSAGVGTSIFGSFADSGNISDSKSGAQYGNTGNANTTGASTPIPENQTFLVIGRFTNVGMTSGIRAATVFILNEAQFANYADGGFGEAEWDAASIGPEANQVFARATDAYTGGSSFNLVNNGGIQAAIGNAGSNSGQGQDVLYDEIRYGSTIADVVPTTTPIPNPDAVPVTLGISDAIATEPTAANPLVARIVLSRTDSSTQAVTVNFTITGTAINGTDYSLPTSATIPAGAQNTVIEIHPFADRIVEPDETVTLTIASGTTYFADGADNVTITIQDTPPPTGTRLIDNLQAGIPQKIVVYGTSLTAGNLWPPRLKAALDAVYPGLTTIVNSGGSGMNSNWGVTNLQPLVIAQAPNTVFIEFSVNDAVNKSGYDNITPLQARTNLNSMITSIQNALPNCEIILQVMSPVTGANLANRPTLLACQQNYRDVGKERGLLVIDHMPAWQAVLDEGESVYNSYTGSGDGLHPTDAGYQLFMLPVLLQEIGAPNTLASGSVMLRANNHRAAEPTTSADSPRTTRITVSRGGPTTGDLVVPLTIGGTATNGADYDSLPASVTIPAGSDSASIEMTPLSDNTVEGDETFTVALGSGAGFTLASPKKASLFVEDRPFDKWRKAYFTSADLLDSAISGDASDPDGDGLKNLIEFYTGHLPKAADATAAVTRGTETISGQNYLTLTYNRVTGTALTGAVQTSTDLANWNSGSTYTTETILSDTGLIQSVKVRSLAPVSASGKGFIRLQVTRDP